MTMLPIIRLVFLFLISTSSLVFADEPPVELFGYELGQKYPLTETMERKPHGILLVEPRSPMPEFDELQLVVTPQSLTIISIKATLRTTDWQKIREVRERYWTLLTTRHTHWRNYRSKIGLSGLSDPPFEIRLHTNRTRVEGLAELSLTLKYTDGAPETAALDKLRLEEISQLIRDHQAQH